MINKSYRVLHMLPDLQMGGGQLLVLRIISCMDRRRFRNFVCYVTPIRELEPLYVKAGFRPVCLEHGPGRSRRALFRLVRLIRQQRIDLVHTNYTRIDRVYGQLAAILCRVPVVDTLHGMCCRYVPEDNGPTNLAVIAERKIRSILCAAISGTLPEKLHARARPTLDRWRGRLAIRHVVSVSEPVRASWDWYCRSLRLPEERFSVIPNGISAEQFASVPGPEELERLRRSLGLAGAFPVLINVGRLAVEKGQRWLIPMMQRVLRERPAAKALIVGEGPERAALEGKVHSAGLARHVMLLGRRDDVPALLAVSDVFAFPSYREGVPLAVLEALAAGKPVVAFRIDAMRGLVEEGVNGHLVEPEDACAMAQKVLALVGDPQRARSMGENSQRIARDRFDMRATVRALERVYLSLLDRNGSVHAIDRDRYSSE